MNNRIKELENKGVYNLTPSELDELEFLVKEEIKQFPARFETSVDKACEAIKNILKIRLDK